MGWACGYDGRERIHTGIRWGKPLENVHLYVWDGRITLIYNLLSAALILVVLNRTLCYHFTCFRNGPLSVQILICFRVGFYCELKSFVILPFTIFELIWGLYVVLNLEVSLLKIISERPSSWQGVVWYGGPRFRRNAVSVLYQKVPGNKWGGGQWGVAGGGECNHRQGWDEWQCIDNHHALDFSRGTFTRKIFTKL